MLRLGRFEFDGDDGLDRFGADADRLVTFDVEHAVQVDGLAGLDFAVERDQFGTGDAGVLVLGTAGHGNGDIELGGRVDGLQHGNFLRGGWKNWQHNLC